MAVDFPKRVIHGGTGKLQREKTHKMVLDFSASVNPFPPKIEWNCDPSCLSGYPDDTYSELKKRIGDVFCRDPEEICVGNGSVEIIRVFCQVVLGHSSAPRRYYFDPPTFGEYELSAQLAGAKRTLKMEEADVAFVCNPNNPTGILLPKTGLLTSLNTVKQNNGILFLDEAFIGLSDPGESLSATRDPSLFILHSLTKTFSVPGIRMGFGFGDPRLVEKIETARSPWCVNAFAEAFAMQALLHLDDLAASRAAIALERSRLISGMTDLGLVCQPSSVNYILVETKKDVGPLCSRLNENGILVRDCTSFGLPSCIRVAVRTQEENAQLLEALAACVR